MKRTMKPSMLCNHSDLAWSNRGLERSFDIRSNHVHTFIRSHKSTGQSLHGEYGGINFS